METAEKILFVDDEPNLLRSMRRHLSKTFNIHTAESGTAALNILDSEGPFAVIVSDYRMPHMDGVTLLKEVKKRHPETIRLMLSGEADLKVAIEAVNSGQIFRFLCKPCPLDTLAVSLTLAIRHYELVKSERELLNKTVKGSINMLVELLSLANPTAFGSGYRIKKNVSHIADKLELKPLWQFEVAALVCQCGSVGVPADILAKIERGTILDEHEKKIYHNHPHIGAKLLRRIPRLEKVASIVAHPTL